MQPIHHDAPRASALGTIDVPFGADFIPFTDYQLFVLPGVALVTLVGLAWFLRRTLTGRVIVAVTTDREAATAMGIDAGKVFLLTFTFGATLAALGGALASPTDRAGAGHRRADHRAVLRRGRHRRARADRGGGADLADDRASAGRIAVYFAPEFEVVVPYIIMVPVLLVRPQGLFGVSETRRV